MKTTSKSMGIIKQEPYIQHIDKDWYKGRVSQLSMLRLDVVHPEVSGNKWYKLKENIRHCKQSGKDTLLTFGGGYSNHLVATAAAADYYGLKSIGLVRGVYSKSTATLDACTRYGMKLEFLSREEYNKKNDSNWLQGIANSYQAPFIIPEGGANQYGRAGAEFIANYIPDDYSHVVLSVGTGTTLAGIVNNTTQQVLGLAPMKGGVYLNDEVKPWISENRQERYSIYDNWHFGGFGKYNDNLLQFMNEFYLVNHIPLDIVYTGKMMYGVKDMLDSSMFSSSDKVLCIHTGGLQGNSSVMDRLIYS